MGTSISHNGYSPAQHSVGTVYANYQLTSVDTHVNADGTLTITLPPSPSAGQLITVGNTGTGTVTVTDGVTNTNVPSQGSMSFIGYSGSWGVDWLPFDPVACSFDAAPRKNERVGVLSEGPYEAAPAIPPDASTVTPLRTFCGGTLNYVEELTYSSRAVAGQYRATGSGYDASPPPPGYGATIIAASDAWFGNLVYTSCPGKPVSNIWLQQISSYAAAPGQYTYCEAWGLHGGSCPGTYDGNVPAAYIAQLTLYYLDITKTTYYTVT